MAIVKYEKCGHEIKFTISTKVDVSFDDVYDVVLFMSMSTNSIGSGWFIRKNGKPIPPCEILWDDRKALHTITLKYLEAHYGKVSNDTLSKLSVLIGG